MIKKPKSKDIEAIVELHTKSLKEGLLYNLGRDILRLLYRQILNDRNSFILAYYAGRKIIGIAASTSDSKILFAGLKRRHFVKMALAILKKSIINPFFPFRLIASRYPSEAKAELLFLFVDPDFRGKGIGKSLVLKTSAYFKKIGVKEYQITILSANIKGKKFYERIGFKKVCQYSFMGEKRDIYMYKIR